MFFIPIGCLIFALFILFLPVLFFLVYFQVLTLGFEKLGISSEVTLILLLLILFGSAVNIPLTKKKLVYFNESRFFGLFKRPMVQARGVAVNLGGAVVPVLLSAYFLFSIVKTGFSLEPVLMATGLMVLLSKFLAKVIPGVGISVPAFIPPVFAAIFGMMLAPEYAAPTAFVAGTLGVLIGADLLNLNKVIRQGGFVSIGGAGVFDGIFLVGIISALLAGF